jgi:enediyne biosynthesis protein E4
MKGMSFYKNDAAGKWRGQLALPRQFFLSQVIRVFTALAILIALSTICLVAFGQSNTQPAASPSVPIDPSRNSGKAHSDSNFEVENFAASAGLNFKQNNFATESKYPFETMGGAVAAFDYNNDGLPDLLFLNGAPSPDHVRSDPASFNRLYKNLGNCRFQDVTDASGLSGKGVKGYPQGIAVGDYDNDGFEDVLITNFGNTLLYHNTGSGTFIDVTSWAGVSMPGAPFKASAAWIDIDNDGWLDLFVTRYFQWTMEENQSTYCGEHKPGFRTYCRPQTFQPLPNALFRNNHDGTFTDVSESSGIDRCLGKGMGVAIADYDNDGWMDIFVTNDIMPNFLFHNERNGTFKEVAASAGVYTNENGLPVSGMGCDFRDYNNDGLPDIFYTDLHSESFTLFLNIGKGLFQDHTFPSNLGQFSSAHSGWSTRFMDWDNDGWKDILAAGSHVLDNSELYNPRAHYQEPCFFYRHLGNGKFQDLSSQLGSDFQASGANRGLAVADFDNDGQLEVAVNRLNNTPLLFKKRGNSSGNWLLIQLRGTRSNRDAIGAKVRLILASGLSQYDHVSTANGIYSASDKRLHFGLGKEMEVKELEISWPSGTVQKLSGTKSNQVLRIVEPEGSKG